MKFLIQKVFVVLSLFGIIGKAVGVDDINKYGGIQTTCECFSRAVCTVWGDPHLDSFYGVKDKVEVVKGVPLNIYTNNGFNITATTFGRDLMDSISFGHVYYWHKSHCKKKKNKKLQTHVHAFDDGSTLEAYAYCKKYRKKVHLNLHLTRIVPSQDFNLFEIESKSNGVCTTQLA